MTANADPRDYQDRLANAEACILALAAENARILGLIAAHAERYSAGSLGRVTLDSLALAIQEGRQPKTYT